MSAERRTTVIEDNLDLALQCLRELQRRGVPVHEVQCTTDVGAEGTRILVADPGAALDDAPGQAIETVAPLWVRRSCLLGGCWVQWLICKALA
jgi:hypothetical protein